MRSRQLATKTFIAITTTTVLTTLLIAAGGPVEGPARGTTRSAIVQGPSLDAARRAVEQAGGEITHELGLIRAVGARIDEAGRRQLEATGGLRVWDERQARLASAGFTVLDRFDAASFANDDGPDSWAGPWLEVDGAGGAPWIAGTPWIAGVPFIDGTPYIGNIA